MSKAKTQAKTIYLRSQWKTHCQIKRQELAQCLHHSRDALNILHMKAMQQDPVSRGEIKRLGMQLSPPWVQFLYDIWGECLLILHLHPYAQSTTASNIICIYVNSNLNFHIKLFNSNWFRKQFLKTLKASFKFASM